MDNANQDNFKVRSNVDQMARATIEFFKICKKNNIEPWLDYGGLLGMIRSGELLPWNNDLHMCCFHEVNINNKMISIVKEMSKRGYLAYYYSTVGALNIKKPKENIDITLNIVWKENYSAIRPHEEITELSNKNLNRLVANRIYWISRLTSLYFLFDFKIFFKVPNYEKMRMILAKLMNVLPLKLRQKIFITCINWSEKLGAKYEKTAIPLNLYEEFISIPFYGDKITVPKNNVKLLEYIYGLDWETPKEKWTFYMEKAKNVSQMEYISEKWPYHKLDLI